MPFDPNSSPPPRPAGLPAGAPDPTQLAPPPGVPPPQEAARMARAAGYTGGPPTGPAPARPAGLPSAAAPGLTGALPRGLQYNPNNPTPPPGMGMRAAGFRPQAGGGRFGRPTKQPTSTGQLEPFADQLTPFNRFGSQR